MRKSTFSLAALFIILLLALTGCFGGDDSSSGTTEKTSGSKKGEETKGNKGTKVLHLNNTEEPGSLHPGLAQGTHDSWVLEHAFEGLTKKTPEDEIVDGMAEKWELADDGVTWTFHLKDDIKWSNGDPVTAEDFEFAWKYALSPEAAADYAYQLYYIKGGEAYNNAEEGADVQTLADAVGIKAEDEKTLVVTLEQPTPYFLDLTSFYVYYPVNKKVQEENPEWAGEANTYVSNGPFKLVEWEHKEGMKLAKNEHYYDKDKIHLDEVEFTMIPNENTAWQMYQSGELDLAYPLPQDVQGQLGEENDPEFHKDKDLAVYYYNINTKKKPFNNAKVRKAFSMAIDRKVIVENVAQGGQKPAYSVVPPGIADAQGDFQENTGALFKEDFEEAKKLLAEGLKEEGLEEIPLLNFMYNTNEGHKRVAEAVQEMWRKNLGVEITLENVEFQVKLDREKAGDYEISRGGWVGDYVDPMTFVDLWLTDGPFNDTNWSNPEYDEFVQFAKTSLDQEERMQKMHDAEKVLIDDMPIIPIYFYTTPYALKSNVTGVYTPINAYPQFKYADIELE